MEKGLTGRVAEVEETRDSDGLTTVTVATFNVLAPCYNEAEGKRFAARRSKVWEERHRKRVIDAIGEFDADVVCLQEFWFSPTFLSLYETTMARLGYQAVTLRRTRHKEDGVAIFVRTEHFDIITQYNALFGDCGDRVALFVLLRARQARSRMQPLKLFTLETHHSSDLPARAIQNGALFMVANTHLTFPHHDADRRMREQQIRKVIHAGEQILLKNGMNVPIIIAGDLNGTQEDPVYSIMQQAGYKSSFALNNSREVGVTHHNHCDDDVGVDYIFFRNVDKGVPCPIHPSQESAHVQKWIVELEKTLSRTSLQETESGWALEVQTSYVYPANEPDDKWLSTFENVSDHRPVVSRFIFRSE